MVSGLQRMLMSSAQRPTARHKDQPTTSQPNDGTINVHQPVFAHSRNLLDASPAFMAILRRESPMTERWRSEENWHQRDREHRPYRGRYNRHQRDHPTRRPEAAGPGSGRFERDDYPHRAHRKRDVSPDDRRPPARPASYSPGRSPRGPPGRRRYPSGSGYTSRDSSPARFAKRRRTRSPSPSDWSDRDLGDRRPYSRSRSRERYHSRDARPVSRRGPSPRRISPLPPRAARPASRGGPADTDTYIPDRRRQPSPPRQRPRRSPSSRPRSATPSLRRRSVTPPQRSYSRPASPSSRYDSPPPHRGRAREASPDAYLRRRSYSRTPSPAPFLDREPMDGPYPVRGHHGNANYLGRSRGYRGYAPRGGSFRGSSVASTPNSSHHGSPHSHTSYHGSRGGYEGPPRYNPGPRPPPRQTHFGGHGPPPDDYFRSQHQSNHPHPPLHHRPFRGRGAPYRGSNFPQHGQDRRFSAFSDASDPPPYGPRGRGAPYSNVQWTPGGKRGGGPSQPPTGPNVVKASPAPSLKDSQGGPTGQDDREAQLARVAPADEQPRQEHEAPQHERDPPQNTRDSKFSFTMKSKPPPHSPARPPSDLEVKAKPPPTRPALDRPPPTQPRGAKFPDKRPPNHSFHQDRRRDDYEWQPPKGPSQLHGDRSRPIPVDPRGRSRSPPPKKLKQELPPAKPTLTPEMAASDSIYFRKPGNESVVGAGTYGKVFKAVHIFTKDRVALKKIRMEGERDGFPITAVREIKLLQNLRHDHVVALQEVMVEKNECFMVFEYMSHDLTGLINHPTFQLTAAHQKDLGRQMFEGLEFLHRRGVMHRDIKAANLLISNTGRLKYADFGLARFYTKSRKLDYTNRVITIWYRPPELLLGETQYGPAVDIWSAACVFMEMFTRKAIFPGEGGELSQLEKIYHVLGTPSQTEWPGMAELPWYELMQPALAPGASDRTRRVFDAQFADVLSPAALDLVTQIFRYDPAARPDAAEILRHDYFVAEAPAPQQAVELAAVGGDWHEYESKAHRRENERRERERRREEAAVREKERRRREGSRGGSGSADGEAAATTEGKVDEVPAAPLPVGEEVGTEATSDADDGSARMSTGCST